MNRRKPENTEWLLKKLREHDLHYSDQEAAVAVLAELVKRFDDLAAAPIPRWREVPAPRMAATQALDWGVNSVYYYKQTEHGEKGGCYELDLPPCI